MASIKANRKDGKIVSFKFRALIGRDENGRQKFITMVWTPPYAMSESRMEQLAIKEAAVWEYTMKDEQQTAADGFKASEILFCDFVNQVWLPSQTEKQGLRASTVEMRGYLLKVILPWFDGVKLCVADSRMVERYMSYLRNTYQTRQGNPLSVQTMKHHYSTLNLIFAHAVKLGYIESNPMDNVDSPRLPRHKVDALTGYETMRFMEEVQELPFTQQVMYSLILTTGIRRGELFGLQWRDVDFANGLLHIERNVTASSVSGLSVGAPKTDTGVRTIPLTEKTISLLRAFKAAEHPESLEAFVFHSAKSQHEPRNPTYLTKHMKRFMKRVGLPDMSPHDLRHTFGTLMLQGGADIKTVQDILGHANASTTLNFYARSDMAQMRGSVERVFGANHA